MCDVHVGGFGASQVLSVERAVGREAFTVTQRHAGSWRNAPDSQTGESGNVLAEIEDTGCGIPPEVQSTIFDRYKQAQDANKKHKGTGLGLAICKNIAEQHGGSIGVESTVGIGSKFWVKIPDRLETRIGS